MAGDELFIDYLLDVEGGRTAAVKKTGMLADAVPGTAEDRCLPHGKSNAAF